jgi:hypothetical protein
MAMLTTVKRSMAQDLKMHARHPQPFAAMESFSDASAGRPTVLTYHEIEPEDHPDQYRISCGQLAEHLRIVAELRPSLPLQVTFDDGHLSNYRYAPELLDKYGMKAIFFLAVGWVETQEYSMSWAQARELVSLGHQVQSHTLSHTWLTRCSPAQLRIELQGSRERIEDAVGVLVDAISIPYGRWNHRVLEACAEAGYRRVYTSDPWLSLGIRAGVELRGRLTVRSTMDAQEIRRLVSMDGIPLRVQRAKFQAKRAAKVLMGDRVYHKLWSVLVNRGSQKEEM